MFLGSLAFLAIAVAVIRFPRRWVAAAACVPFSFALCLVLVAVAGGGAKSVLSGPSSGIEIDTIQILAESLPVRPRFLAAVRCFRCCSDQKTLCLDGEKPVIRTHSEAGRIADRSSSGRSSPACTSGWRHSLSHDFQQQSARCVRGRSCLDWIGSMQRTALYCLIPVIMLIVVLLHRLIWPVLGRPDLIPLPDMGFCVQPQDDGLHWGIRPDHRAGSGTRWS